MRRLLSMFIGLAMGIGSAVAFVTLFAPVSGKELRENLKAHFEDAMEAGRNASEARRIELEQELAEMQNR
ncbi:MAG: YtxH domain-containing protein [Phototrophicaceae bacterium]